MNPKEELKDSTKSVDFNYIIYKSEKGRDIAHYDLEAKKYERMKKDIEDPYAAIQFALEGAVIGRLPLNLVFVKTGYYDLNNSPDFPGLPSSGRLVIIPGH